MKYIRKGRSSSFSVVRVAHRGVRYVASASRRRGQLLVCIDVQFWKVTRRYMGLHPIPWACRPLEGPSHVNQWDVRS